MIAGNLISNDIIPLKTSDTGAFALSIMSEFYVKHLPIVNNEQLLGMVSEDDVLAHNIDEAVGSYNLSMNRPYVKNEDHLFEVMSVMAEFSLTVIPVIDEQDNFLGLITQEDLIRYYANSFSFVEPGSIIVLEIEKRDYSLSTLSQIIESENAAILSSFITADPNSSRVLVTIKVNRTEIFNILASLERYEYQIKATFTEEEEYYDSLKERYDQLMTYLDV